MNKLLFKLQRNFNDDIAFLCNNTKDLEDYLNKNYNWFSFTIYEHTVHIKQCEGYQTDIATIEWIKEI